MIYNQAMSAAVKESVPESYSDECTTLMEGFLGTIVKMTGAIAGAVRVPSHDGQEMHLVGSFGLPEEVGSQERIVDWGCGTCGIALREIEIRSAGVGACANRSGIGFFGKECRSVIAVPLTSRGKMIGIFNLFFAAPQEIAEETENSLRSFGELIGIALENSRQAKESKRISLMTERRWMANEIHDSLAQTMVYARMRMSLLLEAIKSKDDQLAIRYVRDVNDALASGQRTVRELITHFRSKMDPLGLQHALKGLVKEFNERTDIRLDYSNRISDFALPPEHELQAFHIVREILTNVAMHSRATHASLSVSRDDEHYLFTIKDNGSGIPEIVPDNGHYGLTIIRERAVRLGGKIEVESSKEGGTKVILSFPAIQEATP
ncbi:MAG TPA: ATP-binding protein [Burkholderiales bacterium]|nr:ATP-binding protein [Burkholderiales bacterium]